MHSFIALAKKPNPQVTNSRASSVDDKQPRQSSNKLLPKLTDEVIQKMSEPLAVLGFKRVPPQVSVDELVLDDEQVSNFVTLDYLGAYVVSSSNKQRIEEAQKSFDKSDYEIIPNVQLSLLKPMYPKGIFRRRKKILWPVESGIRQAHKNGIIGKGVLVGVLDTGCDADHIQFRQKPIDFCYVPLRSGSNPLRKVRGFDVHGHGTHVCGIIAGQHIGIAPGADIMVASVIESETYRTDLLRIGIALNWMLSQFQSKENHDKPIVVNMSLGFRPEVLSESEQKALMIGIRGFISTLVEDFDVLPIVAIGNDGPGSMHAPGYFPETVSVGAIDFHHQPAPFSGGGLSPIGGEMQPDIAAGPFNCTYSLYVREYFSSVGASCARDFS